MDELGVKVDDLIARLKVRISSIDSVRERMEDKDEDVICGKTSLITLKSGDSFVIDKSYSEISKILEIAP